ncbi:MAG: metallophosphoesterase family protein [Gemmatimonadaceae bacterium]
MDDSSNRMVIGLISDTHGQLRPSVHSALAGVDLILHAGDVGGDEILLELAIIAPIKAVYGNTDNTNDPNLEKELVMTAGGLSIHVSHGHEVGTPTAERLLAKYDHNVVVYGHTHRQLVSRIGHQLLVNPGAAGPQRFKLQPSLARLTIENGSADVEIVPLD